MDVKQYTDGIREAKCIKDVDDLYMSAMIDPEISVVQLYHINQAHIKRDKELINENKS